MSLDNAKMPSLKDKIREQAVQVETVKTDKVEKKEVKKGRRLNK